MQYAEGGKLFHRASPLHKVLSEPIQANRWYQLKVVVRGRAQGGLL